MELNLEDRVWDATSFTNNRDRLLEAAVAKEFLAIRFHPGLDRAGVFVPAAHMA